MEEVVSQGVSEGYDVYYWSKLRKWQPTHIEQHYIQLTNAHRSLTQRPGRLI